MEWKIKEALRSYEYFYTHIDDMELQVNNKLREMSILDLAKFTTKLNTAQDDITIL